MNVYEVIIRLLLAVVVGGLIGYEREYKNRPAGFRTHILVCVGACVISMIQLYDVDQTINIILAHPQLANALKADIGRIGAQVVSGIGFLGAGAIIHQKGSVRGLTTAASLWVVACIGLAVGLGYYTLSILSLITVVLVLVSLKKFESRFLDKSNLIRVEIVYLDKQRMVQKVENYFESKNIKVKNIEFILEEDLEDCAASYCRSLYSVVAPRYISTGEIIKDLASNDEVIKVAII
jgi:putative Mg2+ transporter-C (MgtC) family protein